MSGVVTGLDLSLAGTGVVSVRHSGDRVQVSQRLIGSVSFPKGYQPTLIEWVERQTPVIHEAIAMVEPDGLVVVEAPSHGSKFGNPHERAGIWWAVVRYLVRRGDVVVSVAPKTRAKYATGDGDAPKPKVVAAVREWAPGVHDHNVADAAALAAMGWRRLGHPVDVSADAVLERKRNEAVRVVRWPDEMGVKGS